MTKLSIVATLYKSEKTIAEFLNRSSIAAAQLAGNNHEIILVNDGSPDASLQIAISMIKKYPSLTIIDLSRNFGHHKAMMTGLSHAHGDQVFLIDSDLEEEPEWLISFARQMREENCDVVYGVQQKRKGGIFERYSGNIFYRFLRLFTEERLPENITVARLMTRHFVEALLLHQEREIYIAGLWHATGFKQHSQQVVKNSSSKTTYTLRRKLSLAINSITSFSNLPLIVIFYLGLFISAAAGCYTFVLIIKKLFLHTLITGWTSIMASLWLLGGLIISFLGISGIYLAKIFNEIKRRPYTIVRNVYRKLN